MPVPAVVVSFVLAGIACVFVALCYAELAALMPVSGSTYTYTYASLGQLAAWLVGWNLILEYSIGAAAVAVGWAGYFNGTLASVGLAIPPQLSSSTGQAVQLADGTTATAIANLPAAAIVALLTLLLVRGTRESARLNNFMVALKLIVILAFIGFGIGHVSIAELAAVRATEYRDLRDLWLERRPARRLGRVLHLYRLRRRLQLRAGSKAAAA